MPQCGIKYIQIKGKYSAISQDSIAYDADLTYNGSYGLVEIKLGGDKLIEEGAHALKTVVAKIDTTKMKEPSFLMVLTGTSPYAYLRKDGVYVVPITALKQ